MPNVPIPSWEQFRGVVKLKKILERRVELYTDGKEIEKQLKEINEPLYGKLREALPEETKSFDFNGYQIAPYQGSPRRSFKREILLGKMIKCAHCGEKMTIPVKVLDSAYEMGSLPKPTVSVKKIGEHDGDDE